MELKECLKSPYLYQIGRKKWDTLFRMIVGDQYWAQTWILRSKPMYSHFVFFASHLFLYVIIIIEIISSSQLTPNKENTKLVSAVWSEQAGNQHQSYKPVVSIVWHRSLDYLVSERNLRIVKEWSHQSDWHKKAFKFSAVRPERKGKREKERRRK